MAWTCLLVKSSKNVILRMPTHTCMPIGGQPFFIYSRNFWSVLLEKHWVWRNGSLSWRIYLPVLHMQWFIHYLMVHLHMCKPSFDGAATMWWMKHACLNSLAMWDILGILLFWKTCFLNGIYNERERGALCLYLNALFVSLLIQQLLSRTSNLALELML